MSLPKLFLHGWSQSKQVWQQQRDFFPDATFLNLPGHGGAADASDWITAISEQLPASPCIIIGWSLGGIIAMQLALAAPEKVAALVLVSTTPSFCVKKGWEHGCSDEMLHAFTSGIESQAAKTMSRFFALMFKGDELTRQAYNAIARTAFDKSNPPSDTGLSHGLELLAQYDLRQKLVQIQQPALIIHGEQDAVIPFSAGKQLAAGIADSSWHPISHCGHVPFLTQSEIFNESVEAWCQKL